MNDSQSWIEGFKLVGSAAGIISGAFLVYDRFVRDRPQAFTLYSLDAADQKSH